uniref:Uncharacterized protein n=1 Tax=Romanomermis culicivorax TaxID=13658 RepID=A0A915IQ08_ROMCU
MQELPKNRDYRPSVARRYMQHKFLTNNISCVEYLLENEQLKSTFEEIDYSHKFIDPKALPISQKNVGNACFSSKVQLWIANAMAWDRFWLEETFVALHTEIGNIYLENYVLWCAEHIIEPVQTLNVFDISRSALLR